jgi:hypothetical protein
MTQSGLENPQEEIPILNITVRPAFGSLAVGFNAIIFMFFQGWLLSLSVHSDFDRKMFYTILSLMILFSLTTLVCYFIFLFRQSKTQIVSQQLIETFTTLPATPREIEMNPQRFPLLDAFAYGLLFLLFLAVTLDNIFHDKSVYFSDFQFISNHIVFFTIVTVVILIPLFKMFQNLFAYYHPKVRLFTSTPILRPGQSFSLRWHIADSHRFRKLQIVIRGRRRLPLTPDIEDFLALHRPKLKLLTATDPAAFSAGSVSATIPENALCSLAPFQDETPWKIEFHFCTRLGFPIKQTFPLWIATSQGTFPQSV